MGHGHVHGRGHSHHGRRGHGHKVEAFKKFIYDVDASGDLSDEESAVLEGDWLLAVKQACLLLENFDADGSGDLSDEEKEAARDARRAAHEERRRAFTEIDTDGDGDFFRRAGCCKRRA